MKISLFTIIFAFIITKLFLKVTGLDKKLEDSGKRFAEWLIKKKII